MAKSFFNSIKSAFVTEVPDENLVVETKQSVDEKISQTKQPVFVVPSSAQKAIEGQVNDELLQKLCQAMEDSNLPGPDYLELKNVANNDDMKRAMPDEIQRLTVAFITMKSSNPEMTKERVITSIDEYINMMENERKVGHEQLEVIWNEKVESRKQVVANAEQRIAQIQTELKELVTFVQNENNEIASAINECNINKANFDTTVDFLVNNLMSDKNKLSNALN
jgi:alpha-D-ribose 1-methylphosphonate 5-triphosphate diphosphatase PhnM